MATKTVIFKGTCQWFRPNYIDREFEDADNGRGGNYSIHVMLDEDSIKLWNGIAPRAKLKDGNNGRNLATFRRYEFANFGKGPEPLGPPVYTGFEDGTLIGNGSTVSVSVDVYGTSFKGKPLTALRLVGAHVDNLIIYEKAKANDAPFDVDNTPPVH